MAEHAHHAHNPYLAHHFEDMDQQKEAATLGMWLFLATEVLLFSAMFTAYAVYRFLYDEPFKDAQSHLNIPLGAANTAVLLVSSLTMALAVRAAQLSQRKLTVILLVVTMIFGSAFLVIKGYDWYEEYTHKLVPVRGFTFEYPAHGAPGEADPQGEGNQVWLDRLERSPDATKRFFPERAKLFFIFYFIMTGFHALHMIIGLGVVGWITFLAWRGRFNSQYYTPVEITGLYWHFVDIVWVFLFPVLYLI